MLTLIYTAIEAQASNRCALGGCIAIPPHSVEAITHYKRGESIRA